VATPGSERAIVYLMAGVQFVNILDFLMVSPLGPRFAADLAMKTSDLPLVVGSYTAAASVTGVLGSFYLERFDRRKALVVMLFGLAVGTALGGMAVGLGSLVLARIVAGMFGGPATSLSFAIVADAIPAERRGWAMGIVMGGFAVASVLGVPAGLTLARFGGWRTPFWAVGLLIGVAAFVALRLIPPLRGHLARAQQEAPLPALLNLLKKRIVLLSLSMTALTMMSGFIVIPNIAAFVQFNLGFPEARLDLLYLLGGIASFITARVVGRLVDRFGSASMASIGTVFLVTIVWLWFVRMETRIPVLAISTCFFVAMGFRAVAYNTLASKVPEPHERARFQSAQSAVQHGASAVAAFLSAQLLSAGPNNELLHVERVGLASIALSIAMPIMMLVVERAVRRRAES
jgi:predicted MFS family arabinose efflux permease